MLRLLIFALPAVAGFAASTSFAGKPIQDIPEDTLITLERTACYGFCPDYKLTISAGGSVTYEGRRFVKRAGTVKTSIPRERLKELLAAFGKIDYFVNSAQWVR